METINLATLPTNVIYADTKFIHVSDIFNPKKSNIYLIGNSNMLSVKQILEKAPTVQNIIEQQIGPVNNFSLTYSDLLNMYFIIRSHIPNNSIVVLETSSLLYFNKYKKLIDITDEQICIILDAIISIANTKGIKLIFVNMVKEKKKYHYTSFQEHIHFLETQENDYIDNYHLSNFGVVKYANMIITLLRSKSYLNLKGNISPKFYDWHTERIELAFDLLKHSKEYYDFIAYLHTLKKPGRNGFIAISANPFTLGHQYLIETSSKKVDNLYVIICSSENTFFHQEHRQRMLELGVSHIPNVIPIKSNTIFANEIMFSDYFFKNLDQQKELNFNYMHSITLGLVAPILNIVIRFYGDEPTDKVTRTYMETFKAKASFSTEIIPRKQINGKIVSATFVREMFLKNQDLTAYVPQIIARYLTHIREYYET